MHVAVSPHLMAGVALVGAGVIAVSPVRPSIPDIHVPALNVSSAAVELAALANPIEGWINILPHTVNNLLSLSTVIRADPAPILRQLIANQTGYAQTLATGFTGAGQALLDYATATVPAALNAIVADISQGNVVGAAGELNNVIGSLLLVGFPMFDVLAIPGQITDNLTNVVHALTGLQTLLPLVSGVLGPVEGTVTVAGIAGQAFVDAMGSGDPVTAFSAVINAPAALTDAFINGYTSEDGQTTFPGLLSISPQNPFGAGIVQALSVSLPQAIATALGATPPYTSQTTSLMAKVAAPADVASLPVSTATLVTLNTPSPAPDLVARKLAAEPESATPAAAIQAGASTATDDAKASATTTDEAKVDTAATAGSDTPNRPVIATKDGNKAVPGEVKTGVDADESATTTSSEPKPSPEPKRSSEPKRSPLKSLRDQVKSTLSKLGASERAGHSASRSGDGASRSSGSNGGSDN
jgi:hypothetical protein